MSNLPVLKMPLADSTGAAYSGWELYTYEAGTTTPLATYSDEALTTPNANPVVGDSDGFMDEVYMTPGTAYKFVIKDADGNTVYTVDNIYASQLSSSSLVTRIEQVASNPLDYGAVGDGVADESSEVQDAIDAATGVVDLLGKTFRCDSQITLPSGTILRNGTLDFTNCTDTEHVLIEGTGLGTQTSFTASPGAITGTVASASGLAVGDLVYVSSTMVWIAGYTIGEIARIVDISGTTITFESPLECEYAAGDSAYLKKITTKTSVSIRDVVFEGSNAAATHTHIEARYVDGLNIERCTFNASQAIGVNLRACVDVFVHRCKWYDGNAAAYGVKITDCTSGVWIDSCRFATLYYGVAALVRESEEGLVQDITITNSLFDDIATNGNGYVGNSTCIHVHVRGCVFSDGEAVDHSGAAAEFVDNIIYMNGSVDAFTFNQAYSAAFTSYQIPGTIQVKNNTVYASNTTTPDAIRYTANNAALVSSLEISDNVIELDSGTGVYGAYVTVAAGALDAFRYKDNRVEYGRIYLTVSAGATIGLLDVSDNQIFDEADGVVPIDLNNAGTISVTRVSGNTVESNNDGVDTYAAIDYVDSGTSVEVHVTDNIVTTGGNTPSYAIRVSATPTMCTVSGNTCKGFDTVGIYVDVAGADLSIDNNKLYCSSNAKGIHVAGDGAINQIINNLIDSPGIGIDFDGGTHVNISGNTMRNGNAEGISVTGDSTSLNCTIAGNQIQTTEDGVVCTDCRYLTLTGNTIVCNSEPVQIVTTASRYSYATVSGNNLKGNASVASIVLTSAAADRIFLSAGGNVFDTGTFGVESTTDQDAIVEGGNTYISISNGRVNATTRDNIETLYAEVALTSAQIKALNGSPQIAVAAPPAGYVAEFLSAVLILDYSAPVYDTNGDVVFICNGVDVSETVAAANWLYSAADAIHHVSKLADATLAAATAILVSVDTGNPATGNSVARIKVRYCVHKTGL